MRRIALSLVALALSLGAFPALAQHTDKEADAVTSGLSKLCEPYFKPGGKKAANFGASVKGSGWEMHEAPGVDVFNTEGGWGEASLGFQSDFEGRVCRLRVFPLAGDTTPRNEAPALAAAEAWVQKAMPGAKKVKDRAKTDDPKAPPDAIDTLWTGGKNMKLLVREQPLKGHRPVLIIEFSPASS